MEGNSNNWRILHNEKVGRYVVAGRSFQPSEIILSEVPFVYGPKADTSPLCLGCYAPADGTTLCPTCSWPVCGQECAEIPAHKNAECKVFSESGVRYQPMDDVTETCPQYECIMHLRLLLAKESNPERWESEVKAMEPHNSIRRALPVWIVNQTNVVDYLLGPCKMRDRCDEDLLHTICGIIEVNSFEGRTKAGYPIRAIYPKLAMMSHNCVSNTTHSIVPWNENGEEFRMYVRAAVKVPEGGELFASYTHSLLPTMLRREYLKESKYFDCDCARCADATELGTHMSTLKCTKCDNGIVMSTDPLDCTAIWKCTHCEYTARGETIRKVLIAIQTELDTVEMSEQTSRGIEEREKIFRKYRSVLHPRHAFMTMLRHSLSQMYGRMEAYMLEDLPDVLLERKVDLCRDLLKVLDVIEPGHSRIRGMTLYELHAPLILLTRNLQRAGVIDKKEVRSRLEEAMQFLQDSADILSLEPKSSSEGIIGQVALQSLQQLKDNLDLLVDQS